MAERLSALDSSFLYLEEPTTPMHVGTVMILDPGSNGLGHARVMRHIGSRIAYVPRYRQRVRAIPGRLGSPVWVDDEFFDLSYHVRRAALPRPGSSAQLEELVARLQSRRLDRSRPLWELTLVEGLEHGRVAIITKVHQALVDGISAVDLGQVVLDAQAQMPAQSAPTWHPASEPTLVELVVGAVADSVRRPTRIVEAVRSGIGDAGSMAGRVVGGATHRVNDALGPLALAARTAARPTPRSPLNPDIGEHRRFRMVSTDLAHYRRVRNQLSPERRPRGKGRPMMTTATPPPDDVVVSINDVVLAVIAGALRTWLLTRGEPVPPTAVVRALVPMSVRGGEMHESTGARVASLLVDLPTGEASPLMRLYQISYQTKAHKEAGQAVDAPAIAGIAGFAPPTLHLLGARVASGLSRRLFNVVVTNVPGPQRPLYLDGARMLATYPVIPLAKGQGLSIGLTSYDGGVYYGLNGDRESMADLDVLGTCLRESLTELVDAAR
jgi:diacylglycerol O-acyltransferase / wax synthase